jgi:hypothetical protein
MFLHRLAAAPFLVLFAAALVAVAFGWSFAGALLIGGAIAALLAFPLCLMLFDPAAIHAFVQDSVEETGVQYFLSQFVQTPNIAVTEPATDANTYLYLGGRAGIAFRIIGWGWVLCVAGVLVVVALLRRGTLLAGAGAMLPSLLAGAFALVIVGMPALVADIRFRQGDHALDRGEYARAIDDYTSALAFDAALGDSETFMTNVARAYYEQSGNSNPYGQIFVVNSEPDVSKTDPGLEQKQALMIDAIAGARKGTAMADALQRMSVRTDAELWIDQALVDYGKKNYGAAVVELRHALSDCPDWRQSKFFLGYTLAQMHDFDGSAQLFHELAPTVQNPWMLANVYNGLGDAYAGAGEPGRARAAYAQAFDLDDKWDFWAMKGISGT